MTEVSHLQYFFRYFRAVIQLFKGICIHAQLYIKSTDKFLLLLLRIDKGSPGRALHFGTSFYNS